MTTTGPMVQDYSTPENRLEVHIAAAPAYEFLLSLFVYHGEDGDDGKDIYEAGSTVIERINQFGSSRLVSELQDLAECGCGEVWLGLIGHVFEHTAAPRTIEALLTTVGDADAVALRRSLLKGSGFKPDHGYDEDVIERAASGEPAAVVELLGNRGPEDGLRRLMEKEPDETRRRIHWILEHFRDEVWPHLDDLLPVLERDAAEKRTLARTMSPERLVDTATNGVTFDRQGWMSGIVLIPSAVIRPWVLISSHGSLQIFCYPVGAEHLAADPTAPPDYLVDMFKALADEKRLRILRVIDAGEHQLTKIAEQVDLAKSTAHHHLRVLRSAGLVRTVLTDGGGSRYELRREAIPETGLLLNAFLPGTTNPTATD